MAGSETTPIAAPMSVVLSEDAVKLALAGGGDGGLGRGDGATQVLLIVSHELAGPEVPHVYFAWNAEDLME